MSLRSGQREVSDHGLMYTTLVQWFIFETGNDEGDVISYGFVFFYNYSIMFAVLLGYFVCLLIQNILSSFVQPFQVAKEYVHKLCVLRCFTMSAKNVSLKIECFFYSIYQCV